MLVVNNANRKEGFYTTKMLVEVEVQHQFDIDSQPQNLVLRSLANANMPAVMSVNIIKTERIP